MNQVANKLLVSLIGITLSIMLGFILDLPRNVIWAYTTALSLALGLYFLNEYRKRNKKELKQQQVIAGTAAAQFDALKNQLDPHFLFNSLNVLSSLIEESPGRAQQFTNALSKIYRYVLEQKNEELVSLEEELYFAKTYMQLLEMRFEESLFFEFPQKVNPEAKVVPLSLQLLLENAVKHNVVSETQPLRIKIEEIDSYLKISNNLNKKEVLRERKGVGLQNIQNRYAILTERQVRIEETKDQFIVTLPLLTQKITVMDTYETEQDTTYLHARRRVNELKEFYGNLTAYCLVIPFLLFINYMTSWDFKWFVFPLLGWGLGLSIHGFSVFGYGRAWKERKIREYMEKESIKNNWK